MKNYKTPEYINVDVTQKMRDEWFELHNSKSKEPFDETSNITKVIISFNDFLKDKLNYSSLSDNDKLIFNNKIQLELNKMSELLDEGNGMDYMFGGSKYKCKFNIFKLNKKQFNKLWKKMNNKKVITTKKKIIRKIKQKKNKTKYKL